MRHRTMLMMTTCLMAAGCNTSGDNDALPLVGLLTADRGTVGLGDIEAGTGQRTARFTLTNGGTGPVTIRKAVPSCTCTDLRFELGVIPPGTSTACEIVVDPGTTGGPRKSSVLLVTDDPAHPTLELEVVWRLVGTVEMRPRTLALGDVPAGVTLERQIGVFLAPSLREATVSVAAVHGEVAGLTHELAAVQARSAADPDHRLRISLRPAATLEPQEKLLRLTAVRPDGVVVEAAVSLAWRGVEAVRARPASIVLSDLPAGATAQRRITLETDLASATVAAIDCSPNVTATPDPMGDGGYAVTVRVPAGTTEGEVTFRFADPQLPAVRVPVMTVAREAPNMEEDGRATDTP